LLVLHLVTLLLLQGCDSRPVHPLDEEEDGGGSPADAATLREAATEAGELDSGTPAEADAGDAALD
jgi:hypothetical protein